MKIQGWFIDGFGVFRDHEIRGLGDGLTILYGPNEAGKTTLLWFLRGVLFGFPDSRRARPQYVPLRAGRHGGRVFLAAPDGEYVIDREAGRRGACHVTGPGGRVVPPEELARVLGGADDHLFRNVFAFSLAELESFESLAANGVRERIFSAGIAGAGRSARDVVATLNERAARLVKHHGQARVNNLAAELQTLRRRTEEARRAARAYGDRVHEEEGARRLVEQVSAQIDTLQHERARSQLLHDLWPIWSELADARSALEHLEPVGAFPEDAEARLAEVRQAVEGAHAALEELRVEQAVTEERLGALRVDDAAFAVAGEVEALSGQIALQRERLLQLPAAEQDLAQAESSLREVLEELGAGWDPARVASFDRSIPRREELREWERRLEEAAGERQRSGVALAAATARAREAQARFEQMVAKRSGVEPPDRGTLDAQAQAVRRLRVHLLEHRAATAELAGLDSRLREREDAIAGLVEESRGVPGWLTYLGWLAAVGGGAVGAWSVATTGAGNPTGWSLLVLSAVGAVGLGVFVRARGAAARRREARLGVLLADRAGVAAARDEHERRRGELARPIADDAATLCVPTVPTLQALEECESLLIRQTAARAVWDDLTDRLAEAGAEADSARHQVSECSRALETAEREEAVVGEQWEQRKLQMGVPASLTAGGVVEFLGAIVRAREGLQTRERAQDATVKVTNAVRAWEDRARRVLERAGEVSGDNKGGDELVRALGALDERCRTDREVRRRRAALAEVLNSGRSKLAAAEAALARCVANRDRLFAEGGARDEEAFRRRLHAVRQRQELEATVRERDREVRARAGAGPEASTIRAELEKGSVTDWHEQVRGIERTIAALQDARDDALRHHRDCETARRALEESADVVALDGEREAVEADIAAAVREWRVLTVARLLVEETLREFERSRQPAVLAEASRAFAGITRGRYERIVQGQGESGITVVDRAGRHVRTDALSRGTAEQLYVCVRLGLAGEFARRSVALPLVMDDILVNFDPGRAGALAEILAEFAAENQVLFFTCHPGTRDLLVDAVAGVRVVELPISPTAVTPDAEGAGGTLRAPRVD